MNSILKHNKKILLLLVFLSAGLLFAQTSADLGDVFKKIDMAIATKSSENVSKVLSENKNSPDYSMIEAYTLKKTRQLIITDNLEMARQTSLAVIDNNIENFDAVELYSYIDKAILNQQAANQAAENRKRLEAERIAQRNAKSKQQLANRGNYQTVNTASGQEVYVNEQKASFSPVVWTFKLGIADLVYQKVSEPDFSSLKYGLALGLNIFYPTERLIIGGDIFADAHIVTFSTNGGLEATDSTKDEQLQEFFISGRIVPEIAFSDICKYLFIRAGFSGHMLASDVRERTGSMKTFASPVVGLALDNIHWGESQFRLFYDYDIGHVAYSELKSAMEFGTSLLIPMTVNDKTKVGLELGVQDLLLLKEESAIENRVKFTFAIGVGNVTK